jgi:hypothetical protein
MSSSHGAFSPLRNNRTPYSDSPLGPSERSDSASLGSSGSDRASNTAEAVAAGELGGSYGPYSYHNSGMTTPSNGYSSRG